MTANHALPAAPLSWAAALLAVLLAPGAAASTGDLAADWVTVPDEAVLAGRCRVVHYLAEAAHANAVLTITGETLLLEHDTRWANTSAAGAFVRPEFATDHDEYRNGTFSATAFRAGQDVFLADLEGRSAPLLTWTGVAGRLDDSRAGTVDQYVLPTQGRPERSIDVADSVSWTPSPGWASLSATGDFYVALWEIDGTASDSNHTGSYTTGETSEGPTSGVLPPVLAVGRVEDRLLHVLAFNATLEWRFRVPAPEESINKQGVLAFHIDDATVDSEAPFILSGATGALRNEGASIDVVDDEVQVALGRLDSVRAAGDALAVRLTAPDDAISINGQTAAWPRPEGAPRWVIAAAAVALAVGLALAWRWSRSGLRRLERAMDRGLYAEVVARRGRPGTRRAPQANVLHAVSLLALQRHDEAGLFLEGLMAGERPEPPTFSYLLAAVRAGQGKSAEAASLVHDCLAAAPEYLAEVVANPSLLPLLQTPGRPRTLRDGAEGDG